MGYKIIEVIINKTHMNKQSDLADYFRAMSHRDALKQPLPRLPSAKKRNYQLYDNARGVASTARTYGGRLDEHKYLSEAVSKIREQYDANDIANDNPRVNDGDMTAMVTKPKGNKGSSVSYTFTPKQDKDTSEGYHKTQDRLLKERSKKASYDESVLKGFYKRAEEVKEAETNLKNLPTPGAAAANQIKLLTENQLPLPAQGAVVGAGAGALAGPVGASLLAALAAPGAILGGGLGGMYGAYNEAGKPEKDRNYIRGILGKAGIGAGIGVGVPILAGAGLGALAASR